MIEDVTFNERGLIPAIIQDESSGSVLMMAYMSRESLEMTLEKGYTHFYSRSRERLWFKGETSGHTQKVKEIRYDCDGDSLLITVEQRGVACHTGTFSCFSHRLKGESAHGVIDSLFSLIEDRKKNPSSSSYTCQLFEEGRERILQKVGEESIEVIVAGMKGEREEIVGEVADLLYHLLVFLSLSHLSFQDIRRELLERFSSS